MSGEPPGVSNVSPDAVEGLDTLTLPYIAHARKHASPPVVTTVNDLVLPYGDRGFADQPTKSPHPILRCERQLWTIGHTLVLLGVFVLAAMSGVWVDAQAQIAAAQGDSDGAAPMVSATRPTVPPTRTVTPTAVPEFQPTPFPIPILNRGAADPRPDPSAVESSAGPSTITRLVIPAITLDRKVIEVGWTLEEIAGQAVAVWEVDRYRVGHHQGSSNPGGGSNVVLAGHSGGTAYPFNALFYLKPGDLIEVTSAGQRYQYTVTEHHLVDEVGQPLTKRLENARFMEPTDEEVITMIACWPLTGKDKFTQRVIIRATPIQMSATAPELSPIHPR